MLVIRRRRGESILIGDQIEVQILDVSAGKVTLGIRAPEQVLILRKEIQISARQNEAAAASLNWKQVSAIVEGLRRRESQRS